MKKIFTLLFVFSALLIACSKVEMGTDEAEKGTKEFHIRAIGDEIITKTSYILTDGKYNFSWHADDKIGVQTVKKDDLSLDMSTFTNTSAAGAIADFTAAGSATHDLGNYAFYPCRYPSDYYYFTYDGKNIYYSQSQTDLSYLKTGTAVADQAAADAAEKATVRLFGTITEDKEKPMRHIPLIGIRKGETTDFSFKAATGVLKITLKDLPATATQIRLDATDYALNGYFVFDTNGEIKESYKKEGYGQKYMIITTSGDSERAFYFPIPTGTIPAGKLTVSISDGTNTLYSVNCKQEIVLTRGEITELPSITACPVTVSASGTSSGIIANLTFETPTSKAKVVLAESISAGQTLIDNNNDAVQTLTGTGSTSALDGKNITNSGLCHIVVQTYNSSEKVRGTYSLPVYYLTDADKNKFCKQHTDGRAAVEYGGERTLTDMTITFAVSDDVTKGNILLTEFHGMSYNAAPSTGARFYTVTGTTEGGTFTAGAPMYGVYTPSLGYNTINLPFQSQSAFFTYNGHQYRICAGNPASSTWNFCLNRNSSERYYIRNWNEPTYLRDITASNGYTYSYYFEAYHYDTWEP